MRTIHNKLIRDGIPAQLAAAGLRYEIQTLTPDDYLLALRAKVMEEAQEVAQANPDELLAELADLQEVMDTLAQRMSIHQEDIIQEQDKRRTERGGFDERIYLCWVENKEPEKEIEK
ncbi:MAG: nucleoside triphosphate pyrophosphohydrolase [Synechococcaceae cyanobacterium SM2_3_2]|nr:nucleoside triphosphate pyrophosphohydrolase [Synechococcaceae cyanobacterium SM2_3_2]